MDTSAPLIEIRNLVKHFGSVIALSGVSLNVNRGEVMCLLGDNGAGKSTLIKTLAGVHRPTSGDFLVEGKPVSFTSPRDALDAGIATVYQDLAMIPLMSVTRNFFMGREPTKGVWPLRFVDFDRCDAVTREEMHKIGIDVRDPHQAGATPTQSVTGSRSSTAARPSAPTGSPRSRSTRCRTSWPAARSCRRYRKSSAAWCRGNAMASLGVGLIGTGYM